MWKRNKILPLQKVRESGRLKMDRVFPYTKVKTQGTYSLPLIKMIGQYGSGLSNLWCWTIKPQDHATEGMGIVAGHQMRQRQSVELQKEFWVHLKDDILMKHCTNGCLEMIVFIAFSKGKSEVIIISYDNVTLK